MSISWQTSRSLVWLCAAGALLAACSSGGSSSDSVVPSGGALQSVSGTGAQTPAQAQSTAQVQAARGLTHYYIVNLGTLGGSASTANSINDRGWISGISQLSGNATTHAVLWANGARVDLGTLGGPTSGVGWPVKNTHGSIAGFSALAQTDPLDEQFCGGSSTNLCAGFLWKQYALSPLSTLGGNNSFAAGVNNSGLVVGFAETATRDASCGAPQKLDYNAVIWRGNRRPRALPPVPGDTVSQAVAINDAGAAVGASGPCGPPNSLGYGTTHAVRWAPDGTPTALASLGGTTANIAAAINDRGEVVGQSALTGNTTYHAARWRHGAVTDLGTLPGDTLSESLGLNNRGQSVGYSCDATGTCRGFVFEHGQMTDLNLLVASSSLYVVYAGDINDRGWIVGQAVDLNDTSQMPAVLLVPTTAAVTVRAAAAARMTLPQRVRDQLLHRRTWRPSILPGT